MLGVCAGLLWSPAAMAAEKKEDIKASAEKGAGDCYPICKAGGKENGDAEYAAMMAMIEANKKK